jgi:hypothetical protein
VLCRTPPAAAVGLICHKRTYFCGILNSASTGGYLISSALSPCLRRWQGRGVAPWILLPRKALWHPVRLSSPVTSPAKNPRLQRSGRCSWPERHSCHGSFNPAPPEPEKVCFLLKLPTEVLVKIYSFASKHTGAIKPNQWLPRSAKFTQNCLDSKEYFADMTWYSKRPARTNERLPEALTAVDLSVTCRSIYLLLYKPNDFEFIGTKSMLAYLTAILPRQRNAIRNISVLNDCCHPDPAFTVLSLRNGLRNLTINISWMDWWIGVRSFADASGYATLIKLRGLRSLSLSFHENFIDSVLCRTRKLTITEDNEKAL